MRAAELGYEAKQHLLGMLRDQIGDSKYDELRERRDEDEIIDMILTAGQQYEAAKAAERREAAENGPVWIFWTVWIVLCLIIGGATSAQTAWLWFFSPGAFLWFARTPVIPYRRYGWGVAVSIAMMIGFFAVAGKTLGDVPWGIFFGGGFGSFVLTLLAVKIAESRFWLGDE